MKVASLAIEGLTLPELLQKAATQKVLFLTSGGKVRFVIAPADERDREVAALKSNAEFMAYLTECEENARTHPGYTVEQIREMFDIPKKLPRASRNRKHVSSRAHGIKTRS